MALGLRRFGENKVQEIRDKAAALANDASIEWVVIGHLQTNKAKDVARLASEVQSLDRLELAVALHRQLEQVEGRSHRCAGAGQDFAREDPAKSGLLARADLPAFLDALARLSHSLRVRGLMTLAIRFREDAEEVRACFRQLRELRDRSAITQGHTLPRLSMGMSADFPLAIAEGATEVRIGTAIFRPPFLGLPCAVRRYLPA